MKTEKTFKATIYVGLKIRHLSLVQNISKAFDLCRKYVDVKGECVSFTETKYIYTNGWEQGLIIEFIQYPRFPKPESEILGRALELAELLMKELEQFKVSVITPDKTYMLENDLPDLKQ